MRTSFKFRLRDTALGVAATIGAVVVSLILADSAMAQASSSESAGANLPRDLCPAIPKATTPSEEQRRSARDLVRRAQEAAIVEDNATARELYQRAAALDATDASVAYALGREYETIHDSRAITEYCRFLSLRPTAPEAEDVGRRVASLSYELSPRTAVAGIRRPRLAPGGAFAYGLLFPGSGQYYTHRPVAGLLVTTATAGALYYAFRKEKRASQVTRIGVDPFGNSYEYQDVVTNRETPHVKTGLLAAVGVSLIAAIEASVYARRVNDAEKQSGQRVEKPRAELGMTALRVGTGVGVRIPLARDTR
jgi:hypothetical protein